MSVSVCGTCFADSSLLIYHSRHFFRLFCFLDGICCKSILVSGIRVTIRAAAVRLFVTYSSNSWHYSQVTIDWNYWYWCQCEIRVELLVLLINTVKMICASEENAFCQWRLEILQNQYLKTFPWRCSHFLQIFIVLTAQPVTHTSLSSYGGWGVLLARYWWFCTLCFALTLSLQQL